MKSHYMKLAVAISINTVLMYFITYVMIDTLDHFHFNINRLYMALMMAAPMIVVMMLVMHAMFPNKALNLAVQGGAVALFLLVFALTRYQAPVGNEQFLRSMIPHHSSAILMCEQSSITDPEIVSLCEEIVQTQKEEIAEMKRILARY